MNSVLYGNSNKFLAVIAAMALAFLFSLSLTQSASAQAASPQRRLQISPLRNEIPIRPGTVYSGLVTIKNTGLEQLSVHMSAEQFSVSNNTYDYTFNPEAQSTSWVHFPVANFVIEAGQAEEVKYAINIPASAEPGGVYLSLFAATSPSQNSGSIASTDRVGSLLYITVLGSISQTGSLLQFSSSLLGMNEPRWSATVHNTGTAHFTSEYSVKLETLWGTEISNHTGSALLLPNTIRLLQGTATKPQWLGLYVVRYNIPIGDNGIAAGTRPFIYLPLPQVAVLIALIASISIFWRVQRKKVKTKKQQ